MQRKSELPEGWTETSLEHILSSLESGSRPKGGVRGIAEGIPSIGGEHLNNNGGFRFDKIKFVAEEFFEKMNQGIIKVNDILIVKDGATTGKVAIVKTGFPYNRAAVNEHVFLCRPYSELSSDYIFYFLFSETGQKRILNNFRGSAQGGINKSFAPNTMIPLPPLKEQHRIVSAIEALFANLDATNEKLNRVPKILKKFRQSVLAAACEGRLTEEWRKINQIKEDSWSDLEFFDFCVLQRGYDLPISKRRDGPYPIMASSGILAYHDECKASGPGVVVGRSGSTGKVHYTDEDYWPHNTTLFVKDFKENYPKFVYLFLMNFNLEQYSVSTAVPTLNRNNLRGIIVSIPSFYEQQEIVRRVEELFSFADSIESKVKTVREKTEKLRQSILVKAFSGELVETEAEIARREGRDYETAEVLLERIKAEKGKNSKK